MSEKGQCFKINISVLISEKKTNQEKNVMVLKVLKNIMTLLCLHIKLKFITDHNQ